MQCLVVCSVSATLFDHGVDASLSGENQDYPSWIRSIFPNHLTSGGNDERQGSARSCSEEVKSLMNNEGREGGSCYH